jgi:hypothetical protein
MKAGSIDIKRLFIIQSPRDWFLEQIARKIGLIRLALVFINCASLSKAFLIFSMMLSYSLINSKASVNSFEKNLDSTSNEFSF